MENLFDKIEKRYKEKERYNIIYNTAYAHALDDILRKVIEYMAEFDSDQAILAIRGYIEGKNDFITEHTIIFE